jgi:two-component system sensor histidine kinase MtrB
MTLRRAFGTLGLVLITFTLAASAALLVLRSEVHGVVGELSQALESVRVAEELRIELLEADVRTRPRAQVMKMDGAWDVHESRARTVRLFDQAVQNVQSDEERGLVARARAQALAFFDAPDAPTGPVATRALVAAHAGLRALVAHNLSLTQAAEKRVGGRDRMVGMVGLVLAVVVAVGIGGALLVARRSVLAPLVALRAGIARFAEEGPAARLVPAGPTEIEEVAAAFNAMADDLQRQRAERLAMLGGVAHDLRTPISVLRLALGRISGDRPLPPEPRLREMLAILERQIARLDRMVGDFLDASRIEAGKLELRIEPTDLRRVAEAVVELYRGSEPGRRIEFASPGDAVPARCDPMRIEQALSNLVSNALKYSPAASPVRVALEWADGAEEAVIAVADRGVGLTEEERRQLFHPFARVGTLRDRVAGVGLGLAVASKIVAAHGGSMEVQSEPGEGSRFEIHLPAAREAPPVTAAADAPTPHA